MLGSDSGNTGYTGVPATIVTGYMVLLGLFLACGSYAPVRSECEGGAAVLVVGTLVVPSVQGHGLPQLQELWPSVQSLSCVQLFATPWTAACQASLSITNSRACSNSCPLSWWCHPTISPSVVPFSSHLQSFPASGSFQMSQFFTSGGQNIEVSALASVLPMNIQD